MADYRNADGGVYGLCAKGWSCSLAARYQDYVGRNAQRWMACIFSSWKARGDYKTIQIERLDAEGNAAMSRTLSADRLVLSCGMTVHPKNGRLMLLEKALRLRATNTMYMLWNWIRICGKYRSMSVDSVTRRITAFRFCPDA